MKELRKATLVFLIRSNQAKPYQICLAMKKRGFGVYKLNGIGGKVECDESIEAAAIRETQEEIGVLIHQKDLVRLGVLDFIFPDNIKLGQQVSVFFVYKWHGEPKESAEMKPSWYALTSIPFQDMWPDEQTWLPLMITGKVIEGIFKLKQDGTVLSYKLKVLQDIYR